MQHLKTNIRKLNTIMRIKPIGINRNELQIDYSIVKIAEKSSINLECDFYVTMSKVSKMFKLKNCLKSEFSNISENGHMRNIAKRF